MKQILILTPTYDPSKDGVAEAAKVTACGLAGRGYRVTAATGWVSVLPKSSHPLLWPIAGRDRG